MSIHYNRAKYSKARNNNEYRKLFIQDTVDPWHEGYNENRHGQMHHQLRSYKTWKYNRKTKWKE